MLIVLTGKKQIKGWPHSIRRLFRNQVSSFDQVILGGANLTKLSIALGPGVARLHIIGSSLGARVSFLNTCSVEWPAAGGVIVWLGLLLPRGRRLQLVDPYLGAQIGRSLVTRHQSRSIERTGVSCQSRSRGVFSLYTFANNAGGQIAVSQLRLRAEGVLTPVRRLTSRLDTAWA